MAIQSRLSRFESEPPVELIPYDIRGPPRLEQTTRGIGSVQEEMFEALMRIINIMAQEAARRNQTTRGWEGDLMIVRIPPTRYRPIIESTPCVPLFEIGYHYGIWPENNYDKYRFQLVVYQNTCN